MSKSTLRLWTANEREKLIELVERNYLFLTEGVSPAKTKVMVDRKWEWIMNEINSLGEGIPPLTLKQVKKKWADMKSAAKKAVASYKKALGQTGNRPNDVSKPTAEQERIGSFIGTVNTEPIAGTANCDVAGQTSNARAVTESGCADHISIQPDGRVFANLSTVSAWEPLPNETPQQPALPMDATPSASVRTKTASKKEAQNEKMVELEGCIADSVRQIKDELVNTDELMRGILIEMNRTNDTLAELVN